MTLQNNSKTNLGITTTSTSCSLNSIPNDNGGDNDVSYNNSENSTSVTFASYLESITARTVHLAATCHDQQQYLQQLQEQEQEPISSSASNVPRVGMIIGNEAGDADSIISSLALSYIDYIHGHCNTHGSSSYDKVINVPLVSIPRDDFPLRRDAILLLEMVGVNCDKLMFLHDEDISQIMANNYIVKEWTLVDHNKFRSDPSLNGGIIMGDVQVVEILDHHQDEGAHDLVRGEKRNIAFENQCALVGSTCTLVTERFMNTRYDIDDSTSAEKQVDGGLALVLLGVILLDTVNMSPEAAKGTARDEAAIEFLTTKTDWNAWINGRTKEWKEKYNFLYDTNGQEDGSSSSRLLPNRKHLYEYVQNCKFDPNFWTSMSPKDALRMDYKRFEPTFGSMEPNKPSPSLAFGLSSVLLDMSSLLSKPNFFKEAMEYMEQVNVTLLGVLTMTIDNDDTPKREMLLMGDKKRVHELTDYLLYNDAAAALDISKANDDGDGDDENGTPTIDFAHDGTMAAVHLKQGNPKGSRKQVAPVMLAGVCRFRND
eukprot:CAMPEP_0176499302 /NCGR_PEP_ID=MMETSP0200_2-20121128/12853_1 /TAXON_ID=947934 /ORGANISM="Chaetoceros sp., Strain GSL56" /LENGTH=540 /DNA_ID=CAMNT_0017897709 /DNA_START=366 /DNA_END=1988 /DNA_ORIENTATION=+